MQLQSSSTFALVLLARIIGAAFFGHLGDRIGRKAALVAALLTMGLSTIFIGLLPTYQSIGIAAQILLVLCRFGQGLGFGGGWGGAILLATENAPPGQRARYGMFPQFGAPLGIFCSAGIFLLLTALLSKEQFLSWGWRVPFLLSSLLVIVGLYVHLKLTETPAFLRALEQNQRVRIPIDTVLGPNALLIGIYGSVATLLLFYLMTLFSWSWGTIKLAYPRSEFLVLQMLSMITFAIGIWISGAMADRLGRRTTLIAATVLIIIFGLLFSSLFVPGQSLLVAFFLCLGMFLMGLTYGPLGTALAELFPTTVRYTGASLAFNLAGILGASLAPLYATKLAAQYGLIAVGVYLCLASVLTLVALIAIRRNQLRD